MTGSLYLLADLAAGGAVSGVARMRERLAVLAFAALVVAAIVGIAFAVGYILGKLLLMTTRRAARCRSSSTSDTWTLVRNLAIVLVVVFWLATAYWVFKDARRRIEDPWLVGMAALLGLVPPFVGPIIYMFFRPPEYLEDARERELEIRAIEERLAERDLRCPVCRGAGRRVVPRLPRLHDAAQAGLRLVRRSRSSRSGRSARTARRRSTGRGARDVLLQPLRVDARADDPTPLAPQRLDLPAAWLARPHSSSSSRTACVAALCGEIVARFERRGYELRGARLLKISEGDSRSEHYAEHKGKPFFGELVDFITSGPVLALAVRGEDAIVGRPQDDGRDEPARLRAGDDPRRLRARCSRRTSCTARTRRRARGASWRCSSPTALL